MGEKFEVVKFKNDEFELDVNVDPNNETIWMTANEMAILFEKDKKL